MDLLIDGGEEGLLTVALNAGEFGLQWHLLPGGGLRAMQGMLSTGTGESRELIVGEIFGVPLRLVGREGIFSFKSLSSDSSADLFRFDLSPAMVESLIAALSDAVEEWEDR
ncbi:hypothetical protein G6O69_00975 [Pseudenhygromyxa sp. WMMC2535]|uniref:hypothetical protein n=1 Tax=Pseudenhygromyxa sp. WMMC2535 TaxID=2712867 RepID=UPI0015533C8A|nr:hypothetical protein [Pseudenhygromyxa sp. WMMC2535]NVB36383.1 hypothetical protein [Pseudenhygromyxa sp. WMMC2535]